MRLSSAIPVAALLLAAVTAPASAAGFFDDFAAAAAKGRTTHFLEIENDSMLLKRDDGLYTSGLRYVQQYGMRNGSGLDVYGWRLGQELYTSMDINLPPERVVPPDHPYAGWLYLGLFRQAHRADGSHTKVGLDIGCLGPCAGGEWTQNRLHSLLNQPLPRGWSRQIRNEAGAVLYGEVAPLRWTPAAWLDATPSLHARFGNIFTDAGAGLMVRAGRLNLLPDAPTLHGFMRLDARAVGYNASLQGGYFSKDNPHTADPKRLVGEAELGVTWTGAAFGITASVVRRSNEVSGLSNAIGAQNYARVVFSYTH